MNKAKRIIACILVVAMASISLAGCTTFDNFKKAFLNKNPENDAKIRIGVYEPMTGTDKEAGEAEIKGIELAHKLYPYAGDERVELIYADNKSDIDAAETAMEDLMKKTPTAVLGSYGNIYSLIAGKHIKEAEIPAIAITNTNPLVTKNNPYYFRVSLVDTYQATAMARYVIENLKQTQAGILLPANDDQALAVASSFENYMVSKAGANAVAVYKEYKSGSGDFTEQLEAIKISGIKSVFLCGDKEDVVSILTQAQEMNLTGVTFLGDSTWAEKEFIKAASKYVNGNVAFTTLYTDTTHVTKMSEEFLKAYKEEYGEEPEAAAALGFDAYLLMLHAIGNAGADSTGEQLRDAIMAIENFEGASGIISFDNTGDPEKSVVINTLNGKNISTLCIIAPAGTPVPAAPVQAADAK